MTTSQQLLAELERRAWRRRLEKALRDGLDLEGAPAVHDAIMEIRAELGIQGTAGNKRRPIPPSAVKGAKRYVDAACADPPRKLPTEGEMAQTAKMTVPGFRKWWHGDRRNELLGAALAEHMTEAEK